MYIYLYIHTYMHNIAARLVAQNNFRRHIKVYAHSWPVSQKSKCKDLLTVFRRYFNNNNNSFAVVVRCLHLGNLVLNVTTL